MAERFLVIIPEDPGASLPENAVDLRDLLSDMAGSTEARVKAYDKLQFIDAGENARRIACPNCDANITAELWHHWMNADWHGEDGFHLHAHTAPCCGASLTLRDLTYEPAQGFSRWFVSARDTGRGSLEADEVIRLEKLCGLRLKVISQRY